MHPIVVGGDSCAAGLGIVADRSVFTARDHGAIVHATVAKSADACLLGVPGRSRRRGLRTDHGEPGHLVNGPLVVR